MRGGEAEATWIRKWQSRLDEGQKEGKRTKGAVLTKNLDGLCKEAFPDGDCVSGSSGSSRPGFPSASSSRIPAGTMSAERAWHHTEAVLLNSPPFVWRSLHQTVRVVLHVTTQTLFPEGMKTKRNQLDLALIRAALAGISGLLYVVLHPGRTRSQSILALIPFREKQGLSHPRRQASEEWRKAVGTFMDRQRQALREGEGYDQTQSRAVVYLEDSGSTGYCGFAHEWRKKQ